MKTIRIAVIMTVALLLAACSTPTDTASTEAPTSNTPSVASTPAPEPTEEESTPQEAKLTEAELTQMMVDYSIDLMPYYPSITSVTDEWTSLYVHTSWYNDSDVTQSASDMCAAVAGMAFQNGLTRVTEVYVRAVDEQRITKCPTGN